MGRYEVTFFINSIILDADSEKEAVEKVRKEFKKEVNKKGTFMVRNR